jgi:hypothetical protein
MVTELGLPVSGEDLRGSRGLRAIVETLGNLSLISCSRGVVCGSRNKRVQ